MKKLLVFIVCGGIASASFCADRVYALRNVRVMDGDTVRADVVLGFDVALVDKSIRMSGINAPETHTRNLLEKKAGRFVAAWLTDRIEGRFVELVTNGKNESDKFGRALGYIRVSGENVCNELIQLGYVHTYDGGTKVVFSDDELNEIIED